MMRRIVVPVALTVALVLGATACVPRNRQMAEINGLVFNLSYGSWKWYKANGSQKGKQYYPYLKWSTTSPACSAPLAGNGPYNFSMACTRHDFAWGNLKRIDAAFPRSGNVWKGRNKNAADLQFRDDLNSRCGEHGWWYRPTCYAAADVYFAGVNFLPPYAAPWDAFKQGFTW